MERKKHYIELTCIQVIESRHKYGSNLLTPPKRESLWKLFLEKFEDPIIRILTPPKRESLWKLFLEKFEDPIIRILLIAAFLSLGIAFIHKEFAETDRKST